MFCRIRRQNAVGRLATATTKGSTNYPQWGLSETYDRYGNRWTQTVTAGTGPSPSLSFSNTGGALTNHPDGWCFDASGNLLAKSGNCPPAAPNFVYDGENRMVADPVAGATYVYDGNGTRVQKCLPNCTSPTSSTVYLYSGSQDIAEYNNGVAPSSPSREFIYSDAIPGSGLLASIASGTTTYFHSDHLSWRVSTNASGQIFGQQGSFPFGESWYSSNGNEFMFTSYQRDAESGLDYAMARYYDSTVARFCSADPVGGQAEDPQTWDRYTYSRNDPINLNDPSGQSWWSDLLIGIGVGVGVALLPEIAPAWFGAAASAAGPAAAAPIESSTAVTLSESGALIGISNTTTVTVTATTSSMSLSPVFMGGAIGAQVAAAKSPTPQKPNQTPKKNCPPVPPHPKGADVDANIRATAATNEADPIGTGAKAWWVNQVKTNGVWDYKTQGMQYDDFGNFNYGATGAVFGFSSGTLEAGAVGARLLKSPLSQLKNYGLLNPTHKNDMIRQGMQYKQNDCGKF